MASTKLIRKAQRNRTVSRKRVEAIKRLTTKPVIKNVDIEQIKEEFAKNKTAVKAKPAKTEEVKEEVKAEKTAPKAEEAKAEKAAPKAKKAAPKAKKADSEKSKDSEEK